MNHNFKPGDLAMIVGPFSVPDNIGKTVVLEEFLPAGHVSSWQRPGDRKFIWNTSGSDRWIVLGDSVRTSLGDTGFALSRPEHLMPLRGDFAPERQKSQEVPA